MVYCHSINVSYISRSVLCGGIGRRYMIRGIVGKADKERSGSKLFLMQCDYTSETAWEHPSTQETNISSNHCHDTFLDIYETVVHSLLQ